MMLVHACQLTVRRPLLRRCIVRAESRPEETVDDPREAGAKVSDLVKRRRSSGGRLKKSKRMQALAASLASKTREGQLSEAASIQLPESPLQPTGQSTKMDLESMETKKDFESAVHIPYDPTTQRKQLENDPEDLCVLPKPIYIVSDCTGDSAARTVKAALGQFESSIQAHCPATLLLHRFVANKERVRKVIEDAAKENALVVFTLVDPELVDVLQTSCAMHDVKCVDLWSNLLTIMEGHLDAVRSGLPLNHPNRLRRLDPEYFRRIEAVEYTRKMDDGAHPERWPQSDILLLGVSRCGKTPLSIYLGQRGYKVANLPLVKDLPIPSELYKIDQSKIFALTIDPQYLFKIRRSRIGKLGVGKGKTMYADLKGVVEELEFAHSIYRRNPTWPVLDVTHSGVEESAAMIQRIMSERNGLHERIIYA